MYGKTCHAKGSPAIYMKIEDIKREGADYNYDFRALMSTCMKFADMAEPAFILWQLS